MKIIEHKDTDIGATKNKIINYVTAYKDLFRAEYNEVVKLVKRNREANINDLGDLTKKSDILYRPMYEISETLDGILRARLEPNEYNWLKKGENGVCAGGRWFMKQFPEFSRVNKV